MAYAIRALKIEGGAVLALLAYIFMADQMHLSQGVVLILLFLLGVFVVIHGVFTGIEAAVQAGIGQAEASEPID